MKQIHTVSVPDGSALAQQDRVLIGAKVAVANGAGGGAGAAVVVAVSFIGAQLPAAYAVQVTPSQACMVSVSAKTASGFNVTLTPIATVTLGAGTFDVLVFA